MTTLVTHAPLTHAEPAASCRVEPLIRDAWRSHLRDFPDASYSHLWEYAVAAAKRVGASHEPIAVHADDDRLIAIAAVRVKRLPVLGGIAYIASGPLTARAANLRPALNALRNHYVQRRGLILRILAPVGSPEWCVDAPQVFADCGFTPTTASRHYRTILVNVARPLADIRAGLAQRWRRHLNAAEKQNLTIREGTSADLIAALGEIYKPMVERKGFETELDWNFYESLASQLVGDDRFMIHVVNHADAPVAAMLSCTLGDTTVAILNATSPEGRDLRASYLLHWAVLQHAHRIGAHWLDLTGIDRAVNPGGAQFKDGLGGIEVLAPGPFQALPGPRAGIVLAAERSYRSLSRLRQKKSSADAPSHHSEANA